MRGPLLLVALAACDGAAATAPDARRAERDPYSNVRAADYVGPEACGDCHDEKHASWAETPHAAMNRLAGDAEVLGDFATRVDYAGRTATFTREGDDLAMVLGERRFRVTRTIGSRHLQEYVGVEVGGPPTEIRLPWGWWRRAGRWLPQPYFDSWHGAEYVDGALAHDPFAPERAPWAGRCAWCHNTYPFELRARRDVGHGLEQYVELDGPPVELLPVDRLVTVGISCESCHLGGRAHAEAARPEDTPPRFVPASPDLRLRAGAPDLSGGRDSAVVVDAICAQCHSTPAPRFPDGAAVRNSSEALDLAAGACAPAIACTDCHDPHVAGAGPGAPDDPDHLRACAGCHAGLGADHARHAPGDASCLDCHMPRIVQGISAFVRSHRISSPTDPAMYAIGAPNACNLCHLDRSLGWTLAAIEDGWGVRLAPEASWGPLDAPLGEVWLAGEVRTFRILAAAAYARRPGLGRAALPRLLGALDDEIAFYRMWMLFAIEDVLGRPLAEYDPLAPPARRAAEVRRLRARLR